MVEMKSVGTRMADVERLQRTSRVPNGSSDRSRLTSAHLALLLRKLLPSNYKVFAAPKWFDFPSVIIVNESEKIWFFNVETCSATFFAIDENISPETQEMAERLNGILGREALQSRGYYFWFGMREADVQNALESASIKQGIKKQDDAISSSTKGAHLIPSLIYMSERAMCFSGILFSAEHLAEALNARFADLHAEPTEEGVRGAQVIISRKNDESQSAILHVTFKGAGISSGESQFISEVKQKLESVFGKFKEPKSDWGISNYLLCQPINWLRVAETIGPVLAKEVEASRQEQMQQAALLEEQKARTEVLIFQAKVEEPVKSSVPVTFQAVAHAHKKPNGAKAVVVRKEVSKEKAARPAKINVTVEGERTDFIAAVEKWATKSIGKELLANNGNINIAISSNENSVTIVVNAANNRNMATFHVRSDGTLLIPMNGTSLDFIGKIQGILNKASSKFQTFKKIKKGKGKRKIETSRSYPNFKLSDLKNLV